MFSMIFRLAKAYLLYRVGKAVMGENGGGTQPAPKPRRAPPRKAASR